MIYDIISRIKQGENEERREKSERGKIYKIRTESITKPIVLGGTMLFGYLNVEKEWRVHKEESKLVKKLFTWYENGKTLKIFKMNLINQNTLHEEVDSGL